MASESERFNEAGMECKIGCHINNRGSMGNRDDDAGSVSAEYRKFIEGDNGLVKTFWGYGVLAMLLASLLGMFVPFYFMWLFIFAVLAYQIQLLVAVRKAARKYQGSKLWGYLAIIFVVLGILGNFKNLHS